MQWLNKYIHTNDAATAVALKQTATYCGIDCAILVKTSQI